jgi:hypothetical protein
MPYPSATDLIGLGMRAEQANTIGGTEPAPTVSELCGVGFKAEIAGLLGGVAYASRPKEYDLVSLGMSDGLARQLGQP